MTPTRWPGCGAPSPASEARSRAAGGHSARWRVLRQHPDGMSGAHRWRPYFRQAATVTAGWLRTTRPDMLDACTPASENSLEPAPAWASGDRPHCGNSKRRKGVWLSALTDTERGSDMVLACPSVPDTVMNRLVDAGTVRRMSRTSGLVPDEMPVTAMRNDFEEPAASGSSPSSSVLSPEMSTIAPPNPAVSMNLKSSALPAVMAVHTILLMPVLAVTAASMSTSPKSIALPSCSRPARLNVPWPAAICPSAIAELCVITRSPAVISSITTEVSSWLPKFCMLPLMTKRSPGGVRVYAGDGDAIGAGHRVGVVQNAAGHGECRANGDGHKQTYGHYLVEARTA